MRRWRRSPQRRHYTWRSPRGRHRRKPRHPKTGSVNKGKLDKLPKWRSPEVWPRSAQVDRDEAKNDVVWTNRPQKIVVVSTPKMENADKYAQVQRIVINGAVHETKCVVIAFTGPKVPNNVRYGNLPMECWLHHKQIDVRYQCRRVGPRMKVCPSPQNCICRGCGIAKPDAEHTCTPKSGLCGGKHLTTDRACKTPAAWWKTKRTKETEVLQGDPNVAALRGAAREQQPPRANSRAANGPVSGWPKCGWPDTIGRPPWLPLETVAIGQKQQPPQGGDMAVILAAINQITEQYGVVLAELQTKEKKALLILGDFNAPLTTWVYKFPSKRGRALGKAMEDQEMALLNKRGVAPGRGNSASRDTVPDMSRLAGSLDGTWPNKKIDVGLDHNIPSVTIKGTRIRAALAWIHEPTTEPVAIQFAVDIPIKRAKRQAGASVEIEDAPTTTLGS
ncbi:hypothetical protein HPB48_015756 [Haemaphysalis longicornis]|uniref:Endonuclease/exonuclease/phosphatase domain-containing protein n=1 Tax=Haemaphysalis longicornis TaxID=44386 RepID=A0A9J6FT81_HAELO|nr:hypothetical protein HPB48_015756 [Haemaphysalis longicornis]